MIEIYDHHIPGFAIGELPVSGTAVYEATASDAGRVKLHENLGGAALPPKAKEELDRIRQLEVELELLGGPVKEVGF